MNEELEEISTSGAAGAYNTPYAFVRKPLRPKGKKKKNKYKYKMKMISAELRPELCRYPKLTI